MRFSARATNSPLGGMVGRALQARDSRGNPYGFVPGMRALGFNAMNEALADIAHELSFRSGAALPADSQRVIDSAVVEVGMERLTFVQDLLSAGLTYPLSDPLSVTQLEWFSTNKFGNAQRVMTPSARTENGMPGLLSNRLPIYLTLAEFEIDIRTLRQSMRVGMPIDTAQVKAGTRAVNEASEDAAINGATTLDGQDLKVAGYKAPGLVNAPNAEQQTLTTAAWTGATPEPPMSHRSTPPLAATLALMRGAAQRTRTRCRSARARFHARMQRNARERPGARTRAVRCSVPPPLRCLACSSACPWHSPRSARGGVGFARAAPRALPRPNVLPFSDRPPS